MRSDKSLKLRIVSELYRDVRESIENSIRDCKSKADTIAFSILHMGKDYKDDKWFIEHTMIGVKIQYEYCNTRMWALFNYDEWDMIQANILLMYANIPPAGVINIIDAEISKRLIDIELDILEIKRILQIKTKVEE